MTKFVVTYTRIPTNYHDPQSLVVEAAISDDAKEIVRHHIRDLGHLPNYAYRVEIYTPPPAGKILGVPQGVE